MPISPIQPGSAMYPTGGDHPKQQAKHAVEQVVTATQDLWQGYNTSNTQMITQTHQALAPIMGNLTTTMNHNLGMFSLLEQSQISSLVTIYESMTSNPDPLSPSYHNALESFTLQAKVLNEDL